MKRFISFLLLVFTTISYNLNSVLNPCEQCITNCRNNSTTAQANINCQTRCAACTSTTTTTTTSIGTMQPTYTTTNMPAATVHAGAGVLAPAQYTNTPAITQQPLARLRSSSVGGPQFVETQNTTSGSYSYVR